MFRSPTLDGGRTEGTDSIQPIRVLDAMQLHTPVMPRSPFSLLPKLFLGGPRDIRNYVCNKPCPPSVFSKEPHGGVLRIQFSERGEEERVWIG